MQGEGKEKEAKLAHNQREQMRTRGGDPDLQPIIALEEHISALMGAQVSAVGVCEAEPPRDSDDGPEPARQPSTAGDVEQEEDDTSMDVTQETAASESGASCFREDGMVGELEVGGSGLQQCQRGEEVLWESSAHLDDAQQHSDNAELKIVARQSLRLNSDLLGVLAWVPESLDALAVRMEETASKFALASQQPTEPILGRDQRMLDATSDRGVSDMVSRAMTDVAVAIEHLADVIVGLHNVTSSVRGGINHRNIENRCRSRPFGPSSLHRHSMSSWLNMQLQYPIPAFSPYPLIPLVVRTSSNSFLNIFSELASTTFCGREFHRFTTLWVKKFLLILVLNGLPLILRL
uniref:uncharacterized protein isoform X2 n=1 Tax=Pristiophorus japonicus TaxID=55135 RepID=UPI00398F53E9